MSECGEYQKIICEILAPADAAELDTRCWMVDRDVGPSSRLYSSLCQCHPNQRGLGAQLQQGLDIIREVYSVVGCLLAVAPCHSRRDILEDNYLLHMVT